MRDDKCMPRQLVSLLEHVELSRSGWRERALDQLIVGILWLVGGDRTLEEIRAELADALDVRVTDSTLRGHLVALEEAGALVRHSGDRMSLSVTAVRAQEARSADAEELAEAAKARFIRELAEVCPDVADDRAWELFNDEFLLPLVRAIGARTYELVRGIARPPEWDGLLDAFAASLAPGRAVQLRTAIGRFMDPDDRAAREYVLSCLNAYLLLQATMLEENALRDITADPNTEFVVFVDTNFAFSLLELHDDPANEAVQGVHEVLAAVSGSVKAQLSILPTTVAEARSVLGRNEKILGRLALAKNLVEAALETDLGGVARKYIEAVRAGRVRSGARAYFDPYVRNLLRFLREHGVELFNERADELRRRQDVIDDVLVQMEYEERKRGDKAKTYELLMHDVTLWYFVKEKRAAAVDSPIEAKYWICTLDTRFLAYDAWKARTGRQELPVCLHPVTLLQLLQFWVPRTEKLERALLVSRPGSA